MFASRFYPFLARSGSAACNSEPALPVEAKFIPLTKGIIAQESRVGNSFRIANKTTRKNKAYHFSWMTERYAKLTQTVSYHIIRFSLACSNTSMSLCF